MKKRRKRLLALFLSAATVLSCMPSVAFAAETELPVTDMEVTEDVVPGNSDEGNEDPGNDPVQEVSVSEEADPTVPVMGRAAAAELLAEGGEGIDTPEEFTEAMQTGGTITLGGDINLDKAHACTVQNEVKLDLNGHSLIYSVESETYLFLVKNGGSLTISDSKGNGVIKGKYPIQLQSNSSFVLNSGSVIAEKSGAALDFYTLASNVKAEIKGGLLESTTSNGALAIRGKSNIQVDITGGTIQMSAGSYYKGPVYISGDEGAIEVNISGGKILNPNNNGYAIQVGVAEVNIWGEAQIDSAHVTVATTEPGAKLKITGGTISSSGIYAIQGTRGQVTIENGTIRGGTTTAVYATEPAKVSISGGTVLGGKNGTGTAIKTGTDSPAEIIVTGGTFSSNVEKYVPSGMEVEKDENGNYVIALMSTVYVDGTKGQDTNTGRDAQTAVKTLEKALELVKKEGGKIVVCDTVSVTEAITLENLTVERDSSCTTDLFNVESGGALTLRNMTIDGKKESHPDGFTNYAALVRVGGGTLQMEDGAQLINNASMAVHVVEAGSQFIMNGGVIRGNENKEDGGGIRIGTGTVELNAGQIIGNKAQNGGGGVCFYGSGTLNLKNTEISENHAAYGGGIYLGGKNGKVVFNMTGGSIRDNVLEPMKDEEGEPYIESGGGIFVYGPNATANIDGGVIAENVVTNQDLELEGCGSAISLSTDNDGYVSQLYLSGKPEISGDVYSWDEPDMEVVSIIAKENFAPVHPVVVDVNVPVTDRKVVRIPSSMTQEEADQLFVSADESYYLKAAEDYLIWARLCRVKFKGTDNATEYADVYLRPDTLIGEDKIPSEEIVNPPKGYFLKGWHRYNGPEWKFDTDLVPEKPTMTLQPIFGLNQPTVTVTTDKETAQAGEKITLTANAAHEAETGITYTYQWYRDGQKVNGATGKQLAVTENGSYTVKVKASDGKISSAETTSKAVTCTFTRPTIWYALHFETNGGSDISSLVRESGTTIDLAAYTPVRDGYTFTGWYADEDLTEPITEVKLNSTKTIYAGWEKDGSAVDTKKDQAIYMTVAAQERDLKNGSRTTKSKVCTLKLGFAVDDSDLDLTYSTSDPEVATVEDGKITYQGVGSCVITVTAKETALCKAASRNIEVVVGKLGTPTFTPTVTANTAEKAFVVTSSTVRGVDGWEVQYSIRSDWWRATTKDFPGTGTKLYRKTCTTVHSDMTYYIHVRGYQIIDGEKVYSDWSPVKTIQTK